MISKTFRFNGVKSKGFPTGPNSFAIFLGWFVMVDVVSQNWDRKSKGAVSPPQTVFLGILETPTIKCLLSLKSHTIRPVMRLRRSMNQFFLKKQHFQLNLWYVFFNLYCRTVEYPKHQECSKTRKRQGTLFAKVYAKKKPAKCP